MINKILFITLSNFGDVILTLPVLDVLRTDYPHALITVMVGPRPSEIFKDNPYIHNLIIYNKYAPLREKIQLFFRLKKERYDLVVDLRNTLYGALLPAQFRTSPFLHMPLGIQHMKERNLYRLRKALRQKGPRKAIKTREKLLYIRPEDENYINALLQGNGISSKDKIIIVNPAAGGRTRRWEKAKFIQLCQRLSFSNAVILIGRKDDKTLTQYIHNNCKDPIRNTKAAEAEGKISKRVGKIFDFAGLTNLAQLTSLLKESSLVVSCDTGILQLASYLNIPTIGLFGPSDERRYGPWSSKSKVITAGVSCRPCKEPDCRFKTIECMREISVNKVLDSIDALLKS